MIKLIVLIAVYISLVACLIVMFLNGERTDRSRRENILFILLATIVFSFGVFFVLSSWPIAR